MNIYRISQDSNDGWDIYDAAVVVAANETDARNLHPDDMSHWDGSQWSRPWPDNITPEMCLTLNKGGLQDWAHPDNVKVELVGRFEESTIQTPGVLVASFNGS